MIRTVAQLALGERGTIREFTDPHIPLKLVEMGCLPGNSVELVQIAPLNDPIYIRVNDCPIAIRRSLADLIPLDVEV